MGWVYRIAANAIVDHYRRPARRELGLSVSGMKARVQQARRQLRELLLECCHVELDSRQAPTAIRPRGTVGGTCGASLASS